MKELNRNNYANEHLALEDVYLSSRDMQLDLDGFYGNEKTLCYLESRILGTITDEKMNEMEEIVLDEVSEIVSNARHGGFRSLFFSKARSFKETDGLVLIANYKGTEMYLKFFAEKWQGAKGKIRLIPKVVCHVSD